MLMATAVTTLLVNSGVPYLVVRYSQFFSCVFVVQASGSQITISQCYHFMSHQ